MANYFLKLFSEENNRKNLSLSEAVIEKFKLYRWPGNIRELKNLIERLVIMTDGQFIELTDLPAELLNLQFDKEKAFKDSKSLRDVRDKIELDYIKYCLESVSGNIAKTAELLQVDRTYLYKKIKKLSIDT